MTNLKRPPSGVYAVLERLLRATKDEPLTCVDLFDNPEVKQFASSANRVSDYIGHMHRRGLLQRWTAPPQLNNKARYAYTWLDNREPAKPVLRVVKERERDKPKQNINVTELDDQVVIELADFTVTIKRKT